MLSQRKEIWINNTSHDKIIESGLEDDTVAVCYPLTLSRWFILVTNVVSNNCKYENNIDTNKTDFTNNL